MPSRTVLVWHSRPRLCELHTGEDAGATRSKLNSLRRSQLRAACPRIAFDFLVPCRYRLLCKDAVGAITCALSHRVFHDAVFERVKADDDQAPARLEDPGRRITAEQRLQVIQFTVYE